MPPPKKFQPVTRLKSNRIDLLTAMLDQDKKTRSVIPMLTMEDILREKKSAVLQ